LPDHHTLCYTAADEPVSGNALLPPVDHLAGLIKVRKPFFSEEKKQKTFIFQRVPRMRPWPDTWVQSRNKNLLVLFFRKEHLPALA
jgi:hypothetical protein